MAEPNHLFPWNQPGWFDRISAWIIAELARLGRDVSGPIELMHKRPWSAMARVDTSAGLVYFKAVAPNLRFEPQLAEALAAWRTDCMPPILAIDAAAGWMLSADAGVMLRTLIPSPAELHHWRALMSLCVDVQIDLARYVPDALALGMPDRRLASFPDLYARLLEDTDSLRVDRAPGLTSEEHRRLLDLRPRVAALCERLTAYGLPETLAHEEIHDANVIVSEGRYFFTDWSDSCVGHPFFSLLVALTSTAYRLQLPEDGPELRVPRDSYLESWTAFAPRDQIETAWQIAYPLAMINRALSWHATLAPLPDEYKVKYDAVAGWLQEFLAAETTAPDVS